MGHHNSSETREHGCFSVFGCSLIAINLFKVWVLLFWGFFLTFKKYLYVLQIEVTHHFHAGQKWKFSTELLTMFFSWKFCYLCLGLFPGGEDQVPVTVLRE